MLATIFRKPFALTRHRSTVFGPHLDAYLEELGRRGHRPKVLRRNVFVVTRFGEFLAEQGIPTLADIKQEHVTQFLEHVRRTGRSRAPDRQVAIAAWIVAGLLRGLELPIPAPPQTTRPPTLMEEFYDSLTTERGLSPRTIKVRRWSLDQFLRHLGSDGTAESLSAITVRDIDAYVVEAGHRYVRTSMSLVCTALRVLLRYLFRRGVLDEDLSVAVILPKFYALERLPCALPWETVLQLLDAVDVSTARGLRDRAILTLLMTCGVRPGEIVKLRLDDIDWRREQVRFPRAKAGAPLLCPLTIDAGEAVAAYLRHGRPPAAAREVFIRVHAPHVALRSGWVVSNLVSEYLAKTGVKSQRTGAYVIRHSLAVHLFRKRHPLKTISDVLGHRDPRVAFHYTKLGLEDLQGVALEAREVLP